MVPRSILTRTFHVLHCGGIGTAFTIDVDGRQYLATAEHVVKGLASGSSISVHRNGSWQEVAIGEVWHSTTGADVSLLSLKEPLSPSEPIGLGTSASYYLSQQIYFLGFPFGLHMEAAQINNGFPVPFVKTGIISSFSPKSGGSQLIYCDGYNNPGFSGGPIVVITPQNQVFVIGVVSGYRYNEDPVMLNGADTGLTYRANTGLVIGWGIDELVVQARAAKSGALIS
ncbi:trypsin-like peptidase domain-containing protein [Pantoea sp. Tr-811]|uniref:S1 family peptidase n=1 Tax=Pantoea sp. Tr-811 TaxID=2608361 RepID=UPI001421CD62|nr:serine protease [Pantoea sp. Tr-811]NIF29177.1 trypsin-like peptidase domain-containing protein [Pantoea sp. Tr-811]